VKTAVRRGSARRARTSKAAPVSRAAARVGRTSAPATKTASPGPVKAVSRSAAPARPAASARPAVPARPATPARPLTKRELAEFRRLLEAERDRLTRELEAIEEHLPEVEQVSMDTSGGSYDEDLVDVASDAFEREKGFALENNVQELLNQVEEALARMDEGTYGLCEICGQLIHPERLRALPYARLCIDCKAREEQSIPR
jgi:RNA polymerase-binding protein DksA